MLNKRALNLKKKLAQGELSPGMWISLPSPTGCEVIANAGFDWIIVDAEHSPFNPETLHHMLMAFNGTDTVPLIRVPWNDEVMIKQALDMGWDGVVVPQVNTPDDVRRAAAACRYAPLGIRGFGPRRAGNYYRDQIEYTNLANESVICVIQIENVVGAEKIEEIVKVPGFDWVLTGPYDMSQTVAEFPVVDGRKVWDPEKIVPTDRILGPIEKINKASIAAGIPTFGFPMSGPDWVRKSIEMGCRLIVLGEDTGFLQKSVDHALATFHESIKKPKDRRIMNKNIVSEKADRIVLENDALRVVIEPQMAGKIRSFFSKKTQTELLYADTRTQFQGDGYSDRDISGYEECFPTVGPSLCPEGRRKGMDMGDHGLLWKHPWQWEIKDDCVFMSVEMPELDCRFERTLRLDGPQSLRLDYVIRNNGDEPIPAIYSAHPLLFGTTQSEFVFPPDMNRAFADFVDNVPGLETKTWIDWPPPESMGLNPPYDLKRGSIVKLYTNKLTTGETTLRHPSTGESLRIEFDAQTLPYVGFLIMQGYNADPDGHFKNELLLAIEPTTGVGDTLETAADNDSLLRISPGEEIRFWIRLSLSDV